jgi:hypothetical protein
VWDVCLVLEEEGRLVGLTVLHRGGVRVDWPPKFWISFGQMNSAILVPERARMRNVAENCILICIFPPPN